MKRYMYLTVVSIANGHGPQLKKEKPVGPAIDPNTNCEGCSREVTNRCIKVLNPRYPHLLRLTMVLSKIPSPQRIHQQRMSIQITLLTPEDIPHAITTIQTAFADDPFNFFIYDQSKFSLARNAASLGIRLRWGITNGHILVVHTPDRRCAGLAAWAPPKPLNEKRTWWEWGQAWWLWIQQVQMNLWHGRGGLHVDVPSHKFKSKLTLQ